MIITGRAATLEAEEVKVKISALWEAAGEGGLYFTAVVGKIQGREAPQKLETARWNRVRVNDYSAR